MEIKVLILNPSETCPESLLFQSHYGKNIIDINTNGSTIDMIKEGYLVILSEQMRNAFKIQDK